MADEAQESTYNNFFEVIAGPLCRSVSFENQVLQTTQLSAGAAGILHFSLKSPEFAALFKMGRELVTITSSDCLVTGIDATETGHYATLEAREFRVEFEVFFDAVPDQPVIRKTVTVRNLAPQSILLLELSVDRLELESPCIATRGGKGQPLFMEPFFATVEFPTGEASLQGRFVTLKSYPGEKLEPDQIYTSHPGTWGASEDGQPEQAFTTYLATVIKRPEGRPLGIYMDWAAHDELSDNVQLTQQMAVKMATTLGDWKKHGIPFAFYVLDYQWFEAGSADLFLHFKQKNWPDGADPFLELLEDAGLKLGLWFDTWGMRVIGSLFPGFVDDGLDMLDNLPPNMERLARSPAIGSILRAVTRIAGRTKKTVPCLLEGDYPAKLRGAWEYWVGEQKCQLLKLDFTRFACNNPYHDHLPGKYSEELAVQVLAGLLAQARVANPDLVVLAYNGFTDGLAWLDDTIAVEGRYPASPWWLTIVDMLYCGDPRPANVPVPLFRSAITCYTDYQVQLFHRGLLPWRGIDDSGVLVGQTGTIYHLGKEGWRDAWVMSLCRGHLNPMIYGDLTLFDDADVTFLKATWDLFNAHVDMFAHPTPVGGNPAAGDIYGWACESTEGSGTFVALHNPGFLPRTFLLGDLGGDGWRQIYPGNTPVEFATEVPLGPSAVVLLARGFEEALPELRGEALYANGQALPIFIDKCHRYPQRRRYEGWIRLPQLAASEDFFVVVEFSKALYPWRKIMQPRTEVVISVESKDKRARVRPVAPGKVWSAVSWVAAKVECSVFATPATATIKIEVPWETGVRYLISCYLLSRYL